MKKFLSKISLVAMALSMMPTLTANAAINITLTPDAGSATNNITTVAWNGSTYATNTQITISVDLSATLTATSGSLGDGAVTVSNNNTASITLNVDTAVSAGALTFPVTINLPDGTPTNYAVSLVASDTNDVVLDTGAALFYAYGGNLVTVTASVPSTLSFNIRDAGDNGDTHSCNLGTLSLGSVNYCSYRLRISTNAANGFTSTIQANAELNSNGTATMTAVTNDAAVVPNTEAYGISQLTGATAGGRNAGGTAYDQPVTESNVAGTTFSVDTSPVPVAAPVEFVSFVRSFDGGGMQNFMSNTTLVQHFASINVGTAAGSYSQIVTYTVTGSF